MASMTILTANIAYGFSGMDRLLPSVKHQLHIHGWGALTYEFLPPLRGTFATVSRLKRSAYVQKHRNLAPTLELVRQVQPDVLVLNETIYEIYRDELEAALRQLRFQTFAWGVSTHYPGTTIATLVATKEAGIPIPCTMPQRPSMGGGAGMAGIRLSNSSVSVFGVHLTYRSPTLFRRQLRYLAKVSAKENVRGNEVVLAGDWNECEATILANPDFKKLSLTPASLLEDATCPTFLPRFLRKPLDHVFIPPHWQRGHSKAVAFGSDHLALAVEVQPQVAKLPLRSLARLSN
jgi:endonuclease/exonuclease/phosphatase family metal-dependent hydrolase